MLYITIALFAVAAIVGFIILKNWLTSATTSRTPVYVHGIFVAIALIILIIYAFQNTSHYPKASIILFIVAAMIGFYMQFLFLVYLPIRNGTCIHKSKDLPLLS